MQYVTSEGTQGICPAGWHVPTENEWGTLESNVDPSSLGWWCWWNGTDGGTKLKQGGPSGFNALMTGFRNSSGLFQSLDTRTYLYTSTQHDFI